MRPSVRITEFEAIGTTLPDAYHKALKRLWNNGCRVPCPDWNTEQIEISMTMVVTEPLAEPMISRCIIGGPEDLEQYRQEMLDGILDFEMRKGRWPYTYHQRMVDYNDERGGGFGDIDQIDFIIDELQRNPYSRRAVIDIRNVSCELWSDDPACLQHLQFFIRDGRLHLKSLFRSNDAVKACFMNAFALIMLQKRIADSLGVEMGTYTHRANSFHCYERDYGLLEGYIRRFGNGPTTYNYVGDWDELMEEARPDIAEKVRKLRENG